MTLGHARAIFTALFTNTRTLKFKSRLHKSRLYACSKKKTPRKVSFYSFSPKKSVRLFILKEVKPSPESKMIKLLNFDNLFPPQTVEWRRLSSFPAKMTLVHAWALLRRNLVLVVVLVSESKVLYWPSAKSRWLYIGQESEVNIQLS